MLCWIVLFLKKKKGQMLFRKVVVGMYDGYGDEGLVVGGQRRGPVVVRWF